MADIRTEFLSQLKDSDFYVKNTHAAGSSAALRTSQRTLLQSFWRTLPADRGLYQKCGSSVPITESFVILSPDGETDNPNVNVSQEEFVAALATPGAGNGNYLIYADGTCNSSQMVPEFFAALARQQHLGDPSSKPIVAAYFARSEEHGDYVNTGGYITGTLEDIRDGKDFDLTRQNPAANFGDTILGPGPTAPVSEARELGIAREILTFGSPHVVFRNRADDADVETY